MSEPTALLQRLRAAVGDAHVLTRASHGDLSAFERDWRGRAHGHALAVVLPGSTAEVAAVVQACAAHGANVFIAGTFLFKAKDMAGEIAEMRRRAKAAYSAKVP